jgi:hypothetical protein
MVPRSSSRKWAGFDYTLLAKTFDEHLFDAPFDYIDQAVVDLTSH